MENSIWPLPILILSQWNSDFYLEFESNQWAGAVIKEGTVGTYALELAMNPLRRATVHGFPINILFLRDNALTKLIMEN